MIEGKRGSPSPRNEDGRSQSPYEENGRDRSVSPVARNEKNDAYEGSPRSSG